MRRVWIMMTKDFSELIRQRALIGGVLGPAVVLTILPIVILAGSVWVIPHPNAPLPSEIPQVGGLSAQEGTQIFVGTQFSTLYVLMPVILTSVIAAHSIVGEKTARTLEPLLATPIRTSELLLAKILVALVPGIAITWISGAIFITSVRLLTVNLHVFEAVVTLGWLILLFLWAPLLALSGTAGIVIISSRVNDPRSAQQLSATLVVPFLILLFGQAAGRFVLSPALALVVAIGLGVAAILMVRLATGYFQRDAILTKWK